MKIFVAAVIAAGVLLATGCARSGSSAAAADTSGAAIAGLQSSVAEAVTATTDAPDPVAGGRCSTAALRTFTVRG